MQRNSLLRLRPEEKSALGFQSGSGNEKKKFFFEVRKYKDTLGKKKIL